MDLDTVRLVDHLLSAPSEPLALAGEDREGWEPLNPPAPSRRRWWSWVLAAAAASLVLLTGVGETDEDRREADPQAAPSRR